MAFDPTGIRVFVAVLQERSELAEVLGVFQLSRDAQEACEADAVKRQADRGLREECSVAHLTKPCPRARVALDWKPARDGYEQVPVEPEVLLTAEGVGVCQHYEIHHATLE